MLLYMQNLYLKLHTPHLKKEDEVERFLRRSVPVLSIVDFGCMHSKHTVFLFGFLVSFFCRSALRGFAL